jgi:hypothetical protein
MKFLEKIQSLWSGHGVLEMDKLKKIEDIKTAEIAQKVLAARKVCGRTACSKCYIGDVTCAVAAKAAQDVLEAGEHLLDVDDIKTVEIAQRVVKEYDECSGKICEDCFLNGISCSDAYTIAQDFLEKAKSPKKSEPEPAVPSIQWIDERLMKDGAPAKKIQTIEEALAILVEHESCNGRSCKNCGMRMYEKRKGNECIDVRNEATQFLALNLGLDPGQHLSGNHIYSYLMKQPVPSTIPAKEPVPVIDRCASCKTCKNYNPVGGVPFCNAWHNWTVPEGNCYQFNPLKETVSPDEPEKVEMVEILEPEKVTWEEVKTESSGDEASLPF